jgi:signal transduction histidine kinase
MGWGKKAQALTSAVAAARVAVAPRPDPRVAAELTRTLSARATASCWVAMVIIPFTILAYDGAYYPGQLTRGAIAAAAADGLILLVLIALRRHVFDQHPWLPFALLAGLICNVTEAVNLLLTGGTESDFVFPYYLISFGIAILFPAPLVAVIVTTFLLPVGYLAVALAGHEPLGAKHFASNLMLLVDSALITCIGNRVVTNLFLREVKLRIDLEKANERLRELDRLKSEFFANVSHELRTPLTLILAPASSLSRESHGRLEAGQRTLVETIHRNATRLLQLINDLLLLAKLESGEPRIDRVPVDVESSLRRIADEAQAYAESLDLRLELEVRAGGPFTWNGDERHLDRIVLNLISNACKFSRPGGVVKVAVGSDREGIWISVADQGIGISPNDVDRIFDRFVQVESSSTRRFQGTGIGLSIVKQLVTLHGGRIVVESEPGQGSTFIVHLSAVPRVAAPALTTSSAPELPKVRLEPALTDEVEPAGIVGARLAVVEDNPELLAYLTQELGRWYRVAPYLESTEAVQAIAAAPPDLIVSDIMMPGLDGIALARKVRGEPRTAEVPVILLSAREEVESKIAGFEAGADDYVHKPFDLQELRARIELHLRLRTQAQKLREALEQLKKAEASLVQSEKMVALGRMIAGVAHELNNPIHFLRGNLALLRRHMSSVGSALPLLADIDESVERLTAVTRQLLLFGRKQSGDVNAAVKLADVVPLAVKMVAPQTPKGVRIVQEIDGEVVRANPQDLFQVILNIVHNALQAVDPQRGEVRIAASRNGDRVELSVIDNGCGITKENLSRIFDPFFTTKPPGSGTGLGLSIVQELVAAQNGTVRVESEPGRGTTVAVSLPAVSA